MSLFGPLVTTPTIETWVQAHLVLWMPDYVSEVARQVGIAKVPPAVRTYTRRSTFDKWPEDQLPLVTVISPGTAQRPVRGEGGEYRVTFALNVACVVSAATEEDTRDLAGIYGLATTAAVMQHPNILPTPVTGVEIHGVEWLGVSNDDIPSDEDRSIIAAINTFEVEVRGVLNARLGPGHPAVDPPDPGDVPPDPGPWPTVEEVFVDGRLAAHD